METKYDNLSILYDIRISIVCLLNLPILNDTCNICT